MGFPRIQTGNYSYADYLTWGDDERCELINGKVHDMTAALYTKHQLLSGNLYSMIHGFLKGKNEKVFSAPFDVRFPEDGTEDDRTFTVVQPDLCVFTDPSKIDERGGKLPPEWIIEILSPSSTNIDTVVKKQLYEKHGVGEYWIIDPDSETVLVFILSPEKKYVHVANYRLHEQIHVRQLPGLIIFTDEIFVA